MILAATPRSSTLYRPVGLPRLLPDRADSVVSMSEHLQTHGPVPYRGGPMRLAAAIAQAGLTGRGGAGFPSARKLQAVTAARGRPIVVGNGAEGEPASAKDKLLLWTAPHLVLDGLQLAAEVVGADVGYLYVHDHPRLVSAVRRALAARRAAGVDRVLVQLVEAPVRFLAGQETAVVQRINGGAGIPTFAPVRVSDRGVRGRPTLVHNVETLAHLALIARHGAGWFREVGTNDEPGSVLTTVHQDGSRPVVREVALGTALADVVPVDSASAVLVGGYHGAWLAVDQARSATLATTSLRRYGASVGAGVVAALPANRCGVAETAGVLRYLAIESAGQCGPCLNGLPRIAAALTQLATGRASPNVCSALARWCGLVERRGACAHPDGSARLVRSTLTVFAEEVNRHLNGRCSVPGVNRFLPLPTEPVSAGRR